MAPGRRSLQRLQFGRELVPGTAVAATMRWRGNGGTIQDAREITKVPELVGILGGTDRTHIAAEGGTLSLADSPLTYEQIQYLLVMGLGGPHVGVADGVGSGFVYTTPIPTEAGIAPKSYTVEGGDDAEQEGATYALLTKITIKGEQKKAITVSADLMLQTVSRLGAGFTTPVPLVSVEDAITGRTRCYIDDVTGAYGTTRIAKQVLAFTVECSFMWIAKFPLDDGQLAFNFAHYVGHEITGELVYEHDTATGGAAGAAGEKAKWRSETPRLLALHNHGSALTTPGTYSTKRFDVQLPIKYDRFNAIEDMDGNDTVTASFSSRYNATVGDAGRFRVVNQVAALP